MESKTESLDEEGVTPREWLLHMAKGTRDYDAEASQWGLDYIATLEADCKRIAKREKVLREALDGITEDCGVIWPRDEPEVGLKMALKAIVRMRDRAKAALSIDAAMKEAEDTQ